MTDTEVLLTARWVYRGYPVAMVESLLAKYREPQRHYHTAEHLRHMFEVLDSQGEGFDEVLELAIWYHDREYDPKSKVNELTSAVQFLGDAAQLSLSQAQRARVVELILLSRHHKPPVDDIVAQLFCDLDLAILGEPAEVYERYAAAIRQEYRHVPEALYCAGRAKVLGVFLQRGGLYHRLTVRTDQAQRNLSAERERLRRVPTTSSRLGPLQSYSWVLCFLLGLCWPDWVVRTSTILFVLAMYGLRRVGQSEVLAMESRVRQAEVLFPDEPRRRIAWNALSELYLDTEVDVEALAAALRQCGYSRADLTYMLRFEVGPVVAANLGHGLWPVIGAWAGFDRDWLRTRILWRAYARPRRVSGWFTTRFVQAEFDRVWARVS